jgi:hypothetical protein
LIITVNFEQAASKQGVQQRSTMNRPNSPSAPDYGSGVDPPHGDVRGYFLSEEWAAPRERFAPLTHATQGCAFGVPSACAATSGNLPWSLRKVGLW